MVCDVDKGDAAIVNIMFHNILYRHPLKLKCSEAFWKWLYLFRLKWINIYLLQGAMLILCITVKLLLTFLFVKFHCLKKCVNLKK